MRPRLRLYPETETSTTVADAITVRLSEITPILADAARWNRTWLSDFADDEIQISADLYDVLTAYAHLRPA